MKRASDLVFRVFAQTVPDRTIKAVSAFAALFASLPVILTGGASGVWAFELVLAKWLFSCGIGFCAWRLTRCLPVSLALEVSVLFIGPFMGGANPSVIVALCWSPWILYSWLRIVDGGSPRASLLWVAGLVCVNLAELGVGATHEGFALLMGMNLSGACILFMCTRPMGEKCLLLCALMAAGAIVAAIGSQAWPAQFRALARSGAPHGALQVFQLQPGLFAALFDGIFYKPFQVYPDGFNPSANFFILTGLLCCVVRWRSVLSDRRAAALAVSSLPALVIVFGVVPPAIVGRTPFFWRITGADEAFAPVLVVLFGVLASFGWREAWRRLGSPRGGREGVAVWILLVMVYVCYLGTAQAIVRSAYAGLTWGEFIRVGSFVHVYGISLIVASAILLWTMHRSLRRGSLGPALAVAAALALAALHWRMAAPLGSVVPEYAMVPAGHADPGARP